jgi:hypothetical protein
LVTRWFQETKNTAWDDQAFAEPKQVLFIYHHHYSEKIEEVKFMHQKCCIPLTQTLFHLHPSHHRIHNHASLQIKEKQRI